MAFVSRAFSVYTLVLGVAVLATGCVAGALPPSHSELGIAGHSSPQGLQSGMRFSTGAHLASAYLEEVPDVDVGAGYIYEAGDEGGDDIRSHAPVDPRSAMHGAYLSFGGLVHRSLDDRARTWLSVRSEYLVGEDNSRRELGASVRVNWELAVPTQGAGVDGSSGGIVMAIASGTTAIGLYIEAGQRYDLDEGRATVVSAGFSMKLPFIAFAGFSFGN